MKRKIIVVIAVLAVFWAGWMVFSSAESFTDKIKGWFSDEDEFSPPASVQQLQVSSEVVNLQNAFAEIAERARDSVVSITATHVEEYEIPEFQFFFGDPFEEFFDEFFGQPRGRRRPRRSKPRKYERRYVGMGSGVIIDETGYVLTNEHVISGAQKIQVSFHDGDKPLKAKIVGKDPRTDLAIIKIQSKKRFKALPMGDSDAIRVGDWVIAIGSPFGLSQTVTVGIVSAERQSVRIENREYRNFIQTDAAINKGNSGGPMLNIRGEIVGINTAIFAPTGVFSGIGFAIPINNAKDILSDLIEKGRVVRGWLGVEIRQVDEIICKQFGLDEKCGALVNRVLENSPAGDAGIQRGDIIIEFDKKKVEDVRSLQDIVSKTPPNKKVEIMIMRDKKRQKLTLKTGEMPSAVSGLEPEEEKEEESSEKDEWIGMTVVNVNSTLRRKYEIGKDVAGVMISDIARGSPASEAGLMVGDLISFVNLNKVGNIKDFEKVVKNIDTSEGVVFDIIRRGRRFYISFATE